MAEESYHDLWDVLITLLGEEAPWELTTVSTVAGQAFVNVVLGTGCYRLLRLDAAFAGSSSYVPIGRGQLASDAWPVNPEQWQSGTGVRYYARRGVRATAAQRIGSNNHFTTWRIYFTPTPVAVYSVRLFYVPPPLILISDDNPATYTSFPDEWPEYVVADVSAKVAAKQEADPGPHERERDRVIGLIERYSKPHQVTQAQTIVDARRWQADAFDTDDSGFLNRR